MDIAEESQRYILRLRLRKIEWMSPENPPTGRPSVRIVAWNLPPIDFRYSFNKKKKNQKHPTKELQFEVSSAEVRRFPVALKVELHNASALEGCIGSLLGATCVIADVSKSFIRRDAIITNTDSTPLCSIIIDVNLIKDPRNDPFPIPAVQNVIEHSNYNQLGTELRQIHKVAQISSGATCRYLAERMVVAIQIFEQSQRVVSEAGSPKSQSKAEETGDVECSNDEYRKALSEERQFLEEKAKSLSDLENQLLHRERNVCRREELLRRRLPPSAAGASMMDEQLGNIESVNAWQDICQQQINLSQTLISTLPQQSRNMNATSIESHINNLNATHEQLNKYALHHVQNVNKEHKVDELVDKSGDASKVKEDISKQLQQLQAERVALAKEKEKMAKKLNEERASQQQYLHEEKTRLESTAKSEVLREKNRLREEVDRDLKELETAKQKLQQDARDIQKSQQDKELQHQRQVKRDKELLAAAAAAAEHQTDGTSVDMSSTISDDLPLSQSITSESMKPQPLEFQNDSQQQSGPSEPERSKSPIIGQRRPKSPLELLTSETDLKKSSEGGRLALIYEEGLREEEARRSVE